MKIVTKLFLKILIFACSVNAYANMCEQYVNVVTAEINTRDIGDFSKIRSLVKEAKSSAADLVVFPEGLIFGWLNPEVFTKSQPIPGYYTDKLAEIAKDEGVWLAAGLAERGIRIDSKLKKDIYYVYDSAILINPYGEIVLH